MKTENIRPIIGVQGTVMGWDDPWHPKASRTKMRTGEGLIIPSQDPSTDPEKFIRFIKSLGAELYIHHSMPGEDEICRFLGDIENRDIKYIIGNEYGNANGPYSDSSNRYDMPGKIINKIESERFKGLIYDETEHLQFNPDQYLRLHPGESSNRRHQWTCTRDKSLKQIKTDIETEVRKLKSRYNSDIELYSEHVFPVMYHLLARGGFSLCPKFLKEEFSPVQISSSLGAANQYKRKYGICVDLWGPDIGSWFTRYWAFPGHSPEEFRSALKIAYLISPDFMFVENIDALAKNTGDCFEKTEFGEILEEFAKDFVPSHPLDYKYSDARPEIVIIRSDDCDYSSGMKLFGSDHHISNYKTQSVFDIFHILSHKTLPQNGLTYFLPQYKYHAIEQRDNLKGVAEFPLENGFDKKTNGHGIFYPMNSTLVLDENAGENDIGEAGLILAAGSEISDKTLCAMQKKTREGAVCVVGKWLIEEKTEYSSLKENSFMGKGKWIVTENFSNPDLLNHIAPFLGDKNNWTHRFSDKVIDFTNPSGDGNKIEFEIKQKQGVLR